MESEMNEQAKDIVMMIVGILGTMAMVMLM